MYDISIIVPVYNTEQYLPKCIDSIMNQTYQNFEVILVEDGTKDNAAALCDAYAQNDSRIRVLHQKNNGLAIARRNGVKEAKGKYVMFLDSDDWIDESMLESMFYSIEMECADCVCTQLRRVRDNGETVGKNERFGTIVCTNIKDMGYHLHYTRHITTAAVAKLIKREILEQITFEENLAIGEEHDMVAQLVFLCSKIVISDDAYYNYYMRTNSISHGGYNWKYKNSLEKYIQIEEKFEELLPDMKMLLRAFYSEYEMAVITAMCRNKNYDWTVINRLREVLRKNCKDIFRNKKTAFYYKGSALLIIYVPKLFIIIFRNIYRIIGR